LSGVVEGLDRIDPAALNDIGAEAKRECTISTALRGSVEISHEIAFA
jgi:organic hydroperoxide reductase OsmC/OhrA